jgi:branched-chain amino acid aminotransferase
MSPSALKFSLATPSHSHACCPIMHWLQQQVQISQFDGRVSPKSFPCHTSKIIPRNPFPCHTYKNKGLITPLLATHPEKRPVSPETVNQAPVKSACPKRPPCRLLHVPISLFELRISDFATPLSGFPFAFGYNVTDTQTAEASLIHRQIFHNDRLLPIEKLRLSPGQAGLICGWGLFTTIRIVRSEAFAYERHWRRLEKDAAIIHLPMPYPGPKVRVNLQEVIRANKVTEGCARIYLVYNKVGFWRSDESMPDVDLIIYSSPLPEYHEPVRLTLREHGRHAASPLAGVKTISWLPNVWSVAEAQKEGFDEVVLLNERGEVAECTAANIFIVRGEKIFTPPLNSGCLEGVTRGILFEIAPEAGLAVAEQILRPEDLYSADEVFISSTNRNIIGVGEIAGHKIAAAPGTVTKRVEELFDLHVSEYVSRRLASALP